MEVSETGKEKATYVRSVKLDQGLNEQTMPVDGVCIFSVNFTSSDGNNVHRGGSFPFYRTSEWIPSCKRRLTL